MPLPFSGAATKLKPSDIDAAAARLGCEAAAIQAVTTVEAGPGGGFLSDDSGRPVILFEAYRFSQVTGRRYDMTNPNISSSSSNWKLYKGGAAEYDRLNQAVALNRPAALSSTSWGLFQLMGSNYAACGFGMVEDMVVAMSSGEGAQLQAFVSFVEAAHLARFLVAKDWKDFALGYNGVLFARNQYDTRLASAYQRAIGTLPAAAPLQIGASGDAVKALQEALNLFGAGLNVDGNFGRATDYALLNFQASHSLVADGIAGPATLALLEPQT